MVYVKNNAYAHRRVLPRISDRLPNEMIPQPSYIMNTQMYTNNTYDMLQLLQDGLNYIAHTRKTYVNVFITNYSNVFSCCCKTKSSVANEYFASIEHALAYASSMRSQIIQIQFLYIRRIVSVHRVSNCERRGTHVCVCERFYRIDGYVFFLNGGFVLFVC